MSGGAVGGGGADLGGGWSSSSSGRFNGGGGGGGGGEYSWSTRPITCSMIDGTLSASAGGTRNVVSSLGRQ